MTQYIVHLYREMKLSYTGIEAGTPEAAAAMVGGKPTADADNIEDCEGQNLSALVDRAGDDDYSQSVTIDFEAERIRHAAARLLAALEAVLPYAKYENPSMDGSWGRDPEADMCETAIEQARVAIAEATADGSRPAPNMGDPDIHALLAKHREIAVIWCIEDVQEVRPDLTYDQGWEVLQQSKHKHDSTIGINWDVLDCHADMLFGNAPETDEPGEA
jgi:hypothetical protein